jgi:hypothetical protein
MPLIYFISACLKLFISFRAHFLFSDLNSNLIKKPTTETVRNGVETEKEKERVIDPAEHETNENIARAMNLVLTARERVLTLSEQRVSLLIFLSSFPIVKSPTPSDSYTSHPRSHLHTPCHIPRPCSARHAQPFHRIPALCLPLLSNQSPPSSPAATVPRCRPISSSYTPRFRSPRSSPP